MTNTEFARQQWANYCGDEFMVGAKATRRWQTFRRWAVENELLMVLDKMDELEAKDKEDV